MSRWTCGLLGLLTLVVPLRAQTAPQLAPANTLAAFDSRGVLIGVVQSIDFTANTVAVAFVLPGPASAADDTIILRYSMSQDAKWFAPFGSPNSVWFEQPNCTGRALLQTTSAFPASPTARYVGVTETSVVWASDPAAPPADIVGPLSNYYQGCTNMPPNTNRYSGFTVNRVGDMSLLFSPPFRIGSWTQKQRAVPSP